MGLDKGSLQNGAFPAPSIVAAPRALPALCCNLRLLAQHQSVVLTLSRTLLPARRSVWVQRHPDRRGDDAVPLRRRRRLERDAAGQCQSPFLLALLSDAACSPAGRCALGVAAAVHRDSQSYFVPPVPDLWRDRCDVGVRRDGDGFVRQSARRAPQTHAAHLPLPSAPGAIAPCVPLSAGCFVDVDCLLLLLRAAGCLRCLRSRHVSFCCLPGSHAGSPVPPHRSRRGCGCWARKTTPTSPSTGKCCSRRWCVCSPAVLAACSVLESGCRCNAADPLLPALGSPWAHSVLVFLRVAARCAQSAAGVLVRRL